MRPILRFFILPALAGILPACSPPVSALPDAQAVASEGGECEPRAIAAPSEGGFGQAIICIDTAARVQTITVEMARTASEQQQGLMHRTVLAPDRGMLFPFAIPRPASFWMKNTLIPLDMIFIAADGRVESIIANVPPRTLDPRMSEGRVAAVLELAGGRAAELGIERGDKVRWPR